MKISESEKSVLGEMTETQLKHLLAMQKVWDDYSRQQCGVSFTDLYISILQAENVETITFEQLKDRLHREAVRYGDSTSQN